MRFIEDQNDPDFWTKNHYPDSELPLASPESRATTDDQRSTPPIIPASPFQQVKTPHLNRYARANGHENLFVPHSLVLLAGLPKSGKTTFAVALANAIVNGQSFAGFRHQKQSVGYVSFDDSPAEILAAIDRHETLTEDSPFFLSIMNDPIDTHDGIEQIEQFLLHQQGGVVIIDSLHAALTKAQTRDARQVRNLLTPLKRVAERAGTIILIHHTDAHGKRAADHTQIQAAVSQTVLMSTQELDGYRLIKLECKGRGNGSYRKFHLLSRSETHYQRHHHTPKLDPRDRSTKPILKALEKRPRTRQEIIEITRLDDRLVSKRLQKLIRGGFVLLANTDPRKFELA